MKTLRTCLLFVSFGAGSVLGSAVAPPMGTAGSFAVLAGSTVTNTGSSMIGGDMGVWPGSAITGFPPGIESVGTIYTADPVAMQAEADLSTAYNFAAGEACGTVLSGDLGGRTLTPGVYCYTSSAQLDGTLTLDALGDPSAVFLFQIGSTLMTGSASSVLLTGGGLGSNLFWQVGSSATLGTASDFAGSILAYASITLTTGADISCGQALAGAAVTMDTNNVSMYGSGCQASTSVAPEPGTLATIILGLGGAVLLLRRGRGLRDPRTLPQ